MSLMARVWNSAIMPQPTIPNPCSGMLDGSGFGGSLRLGEAHPGDLSLADADDQAVAHVDQGLRLGNRRPLGPDVHAPLLDDPPPVRRATLQPERHHQP